MSGRTRGVVCAILAPLCWAAGFVLSKGLLSDVAPVALLVIQLTASTVGLWAIALLRGARLPEIVCAARMAWLGALEPALAYFLALLALADMSASLATLVVATETLMVFALSALLFGRPIASRTWWLGGAAIAGLAIALGIGSTAVLSLALMLASTLSAAVYVVLSEKFAAEGDPVLVIAAQHTVALLLGVLALGIAGRTGDVPQGPVLLLAAFSGLVQFAVAFTLFLAAVRAIGSANAGLGLPLIPVFSLILAGVFQGERLTLRIVVGCLVTVTALALLTKAQPASLSRPANPPG